MQAVRQRAVGCVARRPFVPRTPVRSSSVLGPTHINQMVVNAEYAVRGPIVTRALQLQKALREGQDVGFEKILFCNIGNPQALAMQPVTFYRQVIAACNYPELISQGVFPEDVNARARAYLASTDSGSIGAYTHSQGLDAVRQEVSDFLHRRDGVPCPMEDIFLTDGASVGIKTILNLIIAHNNVGVLIPVPQYPLYSASITMLGGVQVPYHLAEDRHWCLCPESLHNTIVDVKKRGVNCRALVVINPGNPTGACLEDSDIEMVISFARDHKLLILADEVYQENNYRTDGHKFTSFRSMVHKMGADAAGVELVSFHSTSKGLIGECGFRGGFMNLTNISREAHQVLYKVASISLCPNVNGQLMTGLMVNPPKEGEASFPLFEKEMKNQYESLRRRAEKTAKALRSVPGMSCHDVQGAMYAFPSIQLPNGAIQEAKTKGLPPDTLFCMELLEHTGVCVVPGSGFGQVEGTYHFRTTILPPEHEMDVVLSKITSFYQEFCARYA